MSEYLIQGETLTTLADLVRAKTGATGSLTPAAMQEQLATLPDAGSGTGASVETCTVVIDNQVVNQGCKVVMYAVTVLENGAVTQKHFNLDGSGGSTDTLITIENVLCNSIVYVVYDGYSWAAPGCKNFGAEIFVSYYGGSIILYAPTTAGTIGTITISDDD